jgi:hypothetical protein
MALATATITAAPARLVVVGFRRFYNYLSNPRIQEDSDWESVASFQTAQGVLDDVSVYTMITDTTNSVNHFVSDTRMILNEISRESASDINMRDINDRIMSVLNLISVVAANSILPCSNLREMSTTSTMSTMSDLTNYSDSRSAMNACIGGVRSDTIVADAFENILLRGQTIEQMFSSASDEDNSNDSIAVLVNRSQMNAIIEEFNQELNYFEELRVNNPPPSLTPQSLSPLTQSPIASPESSQNEENSGGRRTRKHRKASKNKTKKIRKSRKTHKRRRRFRKSKKRN